MNLSVGNPDALIAAVIALGPGMGMISIPSVLRSLTSLKPRIDPILEYPKCANKLFYGFGPGMIFVIS